MVESLELSGYKPYTEVLAQRAMRGKHRKTYVLSLPLYLIGAYLPIPDPDVPFPGNRRVDRLHAEKFGAYWRENEDWVSPPLLVDTTVALHDNFVAKFEAGGVQFGVLRLHQNATSDFEILDGQHRILGWKIVGEKIAEELKSFRSKLQGARELGDIEAQQRWQQRIDQTSLAQARFEKEFVTVEVLQGLSEDDHKQAFNDIATNAKGISKSVTVSFDRRSMINRVAIDVAERSPLLEDRVEWEKDRVLGGNRNIVSGRNLADIVRHVALGITGRMTKRREADMNETAVSALAEKYFATLSDCFPQLRAIEVGELSVKELRDREMVLSPTVLRVLAGTFHNLAVNTADERVPRLSDEGFQQVKRLFGTLSDSMEYPLDDRWYETGYFAEGAKSPGSRAQDLTGLTEVLTSWGAEGKIFVI